ncbi:hypothetical protein [Herbiconiux sp. VKM Ac-2851]|uniref:hypothetical protein n=1 Tax=Herbiconiux sp. VKM Ac-2851 TaxID=2739025 RepID=UPI001563124D|nr:hypothetical protein [Herbiconiux sp. VKM Ac-2851]NQX37184.1 hypothetical protein [Herbiconiux sp. VKM Ac-2851]
MDKRRGDDPTLVRNQTALQQGRRRRWLIPGGILAAIILGLLAAALTLEVFIPTIGIIVAGALFVGMVIVSVAVPSPRLRNRVLAGLMGAMALSGLVVLVLLLLRQTAPR